MTRKSKKSRENEAVMADGAASENSGANTEARPAHIWKPGQSGNPAGKPKGALNKTTLAVLDLMEGEADIVTRKCIDMAKGGDMVAMRLFLERIAPASKSRRIKIDLPPIVTAADCLTAQGIITAAMASGEISPDEADTMANVVELKRRAIETLEFERRLESLEKEKGIAQ